MTTTKFYMSRGFLWLMTRSPRWDYKPKRCKTRRDKHNDKFNRRMAASAGEWRAHVEGLKVHWSTLA